MNKKVELKIKLIISKSQFLFVFTNDLLIKRGEIF